MTLLSSNMGYHTTDWLNIYNLDFTTLGNININSDANYTLNNIIWSAFNTTGGTQSISASNGLSFLTNSSSTYVWDTANSSLPPTFYLPINNIPGIASSIDGRGGILNKNIKYNYGIRIWLYNDSLTPVIADNQCAILGITSGVINQWSNVYWSLKRGYNGTQTSFSNSLACQTYNYGNAITPVSAIDTTNNVMVMEIPSIAKQNPLCYYGSWQNPGWPTYASLIPVSSILTSTTWPSPFSLNGSSFTTTSQYTNICISSQCYPSGTQTTATFKNIRIDIKY